MCNVHEGWGGGGDEADGRREVTVFVTGGFGLPKHLLGTADDTQHRMEVVRMDLMMAV